jgi:hypothetical protein
VWHKFELSDVNLVCWSGFAVFQLASFLWGRWKIARMDWLAADWPVVPGRVSSALIVAPYSSRLVVTYKSTAHGYMIDSWTRNFTSKRQAEHAKQALTGWECPVRYNPACEEQTTLMWADVRARLASVPYVPEIKPLTRAAYRWVIGLAAAGLGGLAACLTVYGMAMVNTSICLCDAEVCLLIASVAIFIVGMGMWAKLAEAVQGVWFPIRIWRVMQRWERCALGLVVVAVVVSVKHFTPMWRAIPINGDIPDKVMAGVWLAMVVPVYLMCGLAALKMLRVRKPVAEAVGSAALA